MGVVLELPSGSDLWRNETNCGIEVRAVALVPMETGQQVRQGDTVAKDLTCSSVLGGLA
jgi:hypothetical protein